jgi:legumain
VLMADDLSKALHTMNTKNMYKEFAFYIEACESGSMFLPNFLPTSLNIYGLTASNDEESSYACYLDDTLNTYLGDCFSVYWMEDSDAHDIQAESLQVQFLRVRTQTTTSHVTQYGALSYVSDMVGEFQGDKNPGASAVKQATSTAEERRAAPQEEVELNILLNQHRLAKTPQEQKKHAQAIRDHIAERERVSSLFERIISHVFPGKEFLQAMKVKRGGAVNFECYKPVLQRFNQICIPLNASSPALNHLYKLANLCNLGTTQEKIIEALHATCV